MGYGWEGKLTRLVPLDKDKHFDNCVAWMNDPEVTAWLLVGDFPLTKLAEAEWFDARSKFSDTEIVFAIETLDGEHIGTSGVHGIDYRNGVAVTGSLIGRTDLWGKGYGTDAAIVRARWAFEVAGLRRLFSAVIDGNERSLGMQRKAGYEVCGRLPQKLWKRGAYRDEILTTLSKEKFLELHGKG